MTAQFSDDTVKLAVKPRPDGRPSRANVPMMPKMSRMEGTKMTSRLTKKMRQNAMPMCTAQRKGLSGNRIWSRARRICRWEEGKCNLQKYIKLNFDPALSQKGYKYSIRVLQNCCWVKLLSSYILQLNFNQLTFQQVFSHPC